MDAEPIANSLHRDLARRKLELSNILIRARESDPIGNQAAWVSRISIVMAYAHWEGFVKSGGAAYIKAINARRLRTDRLQISLQAACVTSHFKRAQDAKKAHYLGTVLSEMDFKRSEFFFLQPDKIINTESNLSSHVFKDLIMSLALDYLDGYETRQAFIDEKLVHSRNQVAHGELVTFTPRDAEERISGVLKLLDTYCDQLIDGIGNDRFLRP